MSSSIQERFPKFFLRALNVFTKFITLFASDDIVQCIFDTNSNTIVLKSLCQSNQAMILCELTGTGKPGDIMGNIQHSDGKIYKYKFDSKALQLLMKHVNKAFAVSMVIEVNDSQLLITTKDNINQPLTQHVLRSIDDAKDDDDFDIADVISGLNYPIEATVDASRFSCCMGISCDETSIELIDNMLRFSTDHIALKTTMLLPLFTMRGEAEYHTQFGKIATSWLANVSGVCAFATKIHNLVMKYHSNNSNKKKRKQDRDNNVQHDEEQEEKEDEKPYIKLFLSSELPLGLQCSLGNTSSLRVYASSRNKNDEEED
jgi:hypothetical protein